MTDTKKLTFDLDTNDSQKLIEGMTRLGSALGRKDLFAGLTEVATTVFSFMLDGLNIKTTVGLSQGEEAMDYVPRLIELLHHQNGDVRKLSKEILLGIDDAYPVVLDRIQPGIASACREKPKSSLADLMIADLAAGTQSALTDQLLAGRELCFPAAVEFLIKQAPKS